MTMRRLGHVAGAARGARRASISPSNPAVIEDRVAAIEPDSLATLIYTSGTTGRPKGVRLRHSGWTYEGEAIAATGILTVDDLQYLWLPMAHSFGKVLLTAQLAIGFPTAVDGRVDKIVENLAVVQPTWMGAAPRIFEKAYGRIVTMAHSEGAPKAKIFDWAVGGRTQVSRAQRAGEQVSPLLAAQHKVADRLVFAKVRARFGGRVRFFISGSAALSTGRRRVVPRGRHPHPRGLRADRELGGLGVNRPDNYRFGTIGLPFPGTEFRIADDGEILMKGPGVMDGYHNMPELDRRGARRRRLAAHRRHRRDRSGRLRADHRPQEGPVQDLRRQVRRAVAHRGHVQGDVPAASQMLVHGNERNFCSALVTLDPDAVAEWAEPPRHGRRVVRRGRVARGRCTTEIDGYISQLNAKLNRWESIKKFLVLDHDLTVESGELTPSMKVKRKVVEDNYRDELDALYR